MNETCIIEDCANDTPLDNDYPACPTCAPRYHFTHRDDCQCRTCTAASDLAFAESLDWDLPEVRDLVRNAVQATAAGDAIQAGACLAAARNEQNRQYQEAIDLDRWIADDEPEPDESSDWRGVCTL